MGLSLVLDKAALRFIPRPVWNPGHQGKDGGKGIWKLREAQIDHQGEEVKPREKTLKGELDTEKKVVTHT